MSEELRNVTNKELRNNCTDKSAWISIRGTTYDVTNFLKRHPGGRDAMRLGN